MSPSRWRATIPPSMHQQAAAVFDTMLDRIAAIQKAAREDGSTAAARRGPC